MKSTERKVRGGKFGNIVNRKRESNTVIADSPLSTDNDEVIAVFHETFDLDSWIFQRVRVQLRAGLESNTSWEREVINALRFPGIKFRR